MPYNPSCAEEEQFLKDFDPSKYKNPAVAADTALFAVDGNALKILLIRRGGYPCKGRWALPGGFVNLGEDIYESAARELEEETGITGIYMEQVFAWGKPDRDPRQRVITISHISVADFSRIKPKAGDDAAEAAWFEIKNYKRKEKDGFCYIDYILEGPDTLKPSVRFPSGRMQQISPIDCGGLAFDHSESIAYSFETLKARIEHGTFLEQALRDEAQRERAGRVITGI